jgi:hypothetical protein
MAEGIHVGKLRLFTQAALVLGAIDQTKQACPLDDGLSISVRSWFLYVVDHNDGQYGLLGLERQT